MPLRLGGCYSLPSRSVDCVGFQPQHRATHSRAALAKTAGIAERVIREAQFASSSRRSKDPCSTTVPSSHASGAHHHPPLSLSQSSLHLTTAPPFFSSSLLSSSWTALLGERSKVHLFIPSFFSSFTASVFVGADPRHLPSSFNLMLSATPGPGSPSSSNDETCSETTSDSSLPSSNDSPSSKLTLVEAFSDSAIAQHLYLFSAPSTENLLQKRLRNTREWIAHNLDPPISERADVVLLQSRTADITNT
eukprot:1485448-Rhodomonas_salina.1